MPLYSLLIKEKAENILSSSKRLESTIQLNYAMVLITSQSYIVHRVDTYRYQYSFIEIDT